MRRAHKNGVLLGGVACVVCVAGRFRTDFYLCVGVWPTLLRVHGARVLWLLRLHRRAVWIGPPWLRERHRRSLDQAVPGSEVVSFHVIKVSTKAWNKVGTLKDLVITSDRIMKNGAARSGSKTHLLVSLSGSSRLWCRPAWWGSVVSQAGVRS